MNDKIKKITFSQLAANVGNGFIYGQGFAILGAAHYSIFNSRSGQRLKDFASTFLSSAHMTSSNSMAQYSLVHTFIDPFFDEKHFKNPYLRSMASGATAGAIIEWRNGATSMLLGAAGGAAQNIFMNIFFTGIGYVLRPAHAMISSYKLKKLKEKQKKVLISSPFALIKDTIYSNMFHH